MHRDETQFRPKHHRFPCKTVHTLMRHKVVPNPVTNACTRQLNTMDLFGMCRCRCNTGAHHAHLDTQGATS